MSKGKKGYLADNDEELVVIGLSRKKNNSEFDPDEEQAPPRRDNQESAFQIIDYTLEGTPSCYAVVFVSKQMPDILNRTLTPFDVLLMPDKNLLFILEKKPDPDELHENITKGLSPRLQQKIFGAFRMHIIPMYQPMDLLVKRRGSVDVLVELNESLKRNCEIVHTFDCPVSPRKPKERSVSLTYRLIEKELLKLQKPPQQKIASDNKENIQAVFSKRKRAFKFSKGKPRDPNDKASLKNSR